MTCKNCIYFQQEEVVIPLPIVGDLVQNTFANVTIGAKQYTIARCSNKSNTTENVTRGDATKSFMTDSENQKVFTYSGIIAVSELDNCPLFDDGVED